MTSGSEFPWQPRVLPPVWVMLCVLLQLALDRWFPLMVFDAPWSRMTGAGLILAGLGLILWSAWWFRRRQTPIVPGNAPLAMITDGPYRLSRNPIYAGMLLIITGLAFAMGSLTPFLVVTLLFGLLRDLFVVPEERIMEEEFGDQWRDYTKRVRRWL